MPTLPPEDLESSAMRVGELWRELADRRVLITGGTGFVGRWLVETLARAREMADLDCHVSLLTRSITSTRERWPWLATQHWITLLESDVRELAPDQGSIDVVLHGAADTAISAISSDVAEVCDAGTRRMLEVASRSGATRFHLVSSGAVYAPRGLGDADPSEQESIEAGVPCAYGAYGSGKRTAERLASRLVSSMSITISRVFGLIGPGLPLDGRFAIGNFIGDALRGGPIRIHGDGRSVRSYLHGGDLASWIWTIALAGRTGTVLNVGSDHAITMADLANRVRDLLAPRSAVEIEANPGVDRSRYVPNISRGRVLLGLRCHHDLDHGIVGTARYYHAL